MELGLASFAPVLGLLAFRSRGDAWGWLFLVPAAMGVLVLIGGFVVVRRGNPEPFDFDEIEDLSGEILGHIGAYLLPVLIDTSKSTEEVVISAIVLALIIHIHVATGRVFVNPLRTSSATGSTALEPVEQPYISSPAAMSARGRPRAAASESDPACWSSATSRS